MAAAAAASSSTTAVDPSRAGRLWAYVIGLDLFSDPAGAEALVAYWMRTYAPRPVDNVPSDAFVRLLETVARIGPRDFCLDLWWNPLTPPPNASDLCVVRLLRADLDLGFPLPLLVRARRHRTLRALKAIVRARHGRPPVNAGLFGVAGLTGMGGELQLGAFFAAPCLSAAWNVPLMLGLLLAAWVVARAEWRVHDVDRALATQMDLQIARAFEACVQAHVPPSLWPPLDGLGRALEQLAREGSALDTPGSGALFVLDRAQALKRWAQRGQRGQIRQLRAEGY
jgi:hypothetical protein